MYYIVFILIIAALMSAAAVIAMLVLHWHRARDELTAAAMKIEICLLNVLIVNFIGFLLQSSIPQPDRRILFILMSVANISIGAATWQVACATLALLKRRRSVLVDALSLAGIAAVYVVSVYFALFHNATEAMQYDNRVGFMIPSIVSAAGGIACAVGFLSRLSAIPRGWRSMAARSALGLVAISILSIANETLPLAEWLGVAQLPLSPLLLIAMNGLLFILLWRRLKESGTPVPEAVPETFGVSASPDRIAFDNRLFDERAIADASCSLARRYGLSGREEEIAGFVIAGELNSAIAERLFISVYTVKNHIHSIFGKTGAKNRIDLMRIGNEAIKTTT
ncbi:MAG: hypothetical protein A2004_11475 [Spirochaetes bacterium GWC1_61_12]|nr:MAG: hypothetical protein A2Y37_01445 [Spirochaetes bacterium GWB1_60_80]OHD30692.1 MAG: hypothetical protein A2004_11475 [Spirochaetes bacterium GWC1_61_12]OHD45194.1 MAG: hypothetical protein A2Y35_10520 [Spirochaetes bacterium GWE1_60_18]OHD60168.1 MAG: hypothetical protein A2Y32_01785 [Spirochaetes bacterium GWF1_60_12]